MILVFAAPIGPCGSRTPPEQPARKRSGTSAPAIVGDSARRFEGRKTVDQYIDDGRQASLWRDGVGSGKTVFRQILFQWRRCSTPLEQNFATCRLARA